MKNKKNPVPLTPISATLSKDKDRLRKALKVVCDEWVEGLNRRHELKNYHAFLTEWPSEKSNRHEPYSPKIRIRGMKGE